MFKNCYLLAIAIGLHCHSLVAQGAQDLMLEIPQLYPENGASLSCTGKMYFSCLYKASVVEYDPATRLHKEINIANITGNRNAHVSGIEADVSGSFLWALADPAFAFSTNGKNLLGPEALISINPTSQAVDVINLKPILSQATQNNGGVPVGGTQDAAVAPDGTVYVIITFGQTILKVNPKTKTPAIFYSEKHPKPNVMSYSGVELVNNNTLLVWNDITSRIESVDTRTSNPAPRAVTVSQLRGVKTGFISGDAIFSPSFKKGHCLLVSNNGAKTIEVFTSSDGWFSATHTASLDASRPSGVPSFTYEMQGKIFFGVAYFGDGNYGGSRKSFPQFDITNQVKKACEGTA